MCYKTWMEKQLNLYVAWDHFARNINLHVSLIHIGNPLNDFNHTYMPHLDSHPDDPLFWKHCSKGCMRLEGGPPMLYVTLLILLPMITTCPFCDVVWMKI